MGDAEDQLQQRILDAVSQYERDRRKAAGRERYVESALELREAIRRVLEAYGARGAAVVLTLMREELKDVPPHEMLLNYHDVQEFLAALPDRPGEAVVNTIFSPTTLAEGEPRVLDPSQLPPARPVPPAEPGNTPSE